MRSDPRPGGLGRTGKGGVKSVTPDADANTERVLRRFARTDARDAKGGGVNRISFVPHLTGLSEPGSSGGATATARDVRDAGPARGS